MTGAGRAAFIRANTRVLPVPHAPEIRLHLADEATELWHKTEEELGRLVGEMEPDLGRMRDRQHPGVGPDEGGAVGAGHGGAASIAA